MSRIRNTTMDAVKAVAIFLVVLGHCVQYLSGTDFRENPIYQIIYSFHMPLFFVVSGFFFVGQENKSVKDFLIRKSTTLLLPCLVWATMSACGSLLINRDIPAFFLKIINPVTWPFWFLKALFVVQCVAYLCLRITRSRVVMAALLSLCVFLIPGMEIARVMLPFLWGGWILRMNYDRLKENAFVVTFISGVVFVGLLFFWNSQSLRMSSGTTLSLYGCFTDAAQPWTTWVRFLYRLVIGAAGSMTVIGGLHLLPKIPLWIQIVGTSTEGIYILQACFLEHLLGGFIAQKTTWLLPLQQLPAGLLYGLALPVAAILIVAFCTLLYQSTRYFPIAGRILFGGAPVQSQQK